MSVRFILLSFFMIQICTSAYTQAFSVLTCSRGDEIYSTFGHSAIRYQDAAQGIDWVYNYGLFDFYDPNFIPKFCMGKLDYMVAKESMNDFMAQYVYQQREVKEHVLNLSPAARDSLLKFLEWNIREENKYYRYDFLYNNCATKIIEVIRKNCAPVELKFYEELDKRSFRELIHANAQKSVPWIDWGMDVALGLSVDKKATAAEYCFLPEFVAKSIAKSRFQGLPLVAREVILIPETKRMVGKFSWLTSPFSAALLILCIAVGLKWRPQSWANIFWGVFFLILGFGGLIIGFEWFFTEHSVTKNNLNLLWLNPLMIPFGIGVLLKKNWYFLNKLVGLSLLLVFIASIFQFQDTHLVSKLMIAVALFYFSSLNLKFTKQYTDEI